MTALNGVRVEADGTRSNIAIPASNRSAFLKEELGGWPEYAHYGTPDFAACVIVHETSVIDGLPVNRAATQFAALTRGGPLSYSLHGPVILLGYQPRTDTLTDLTDHQRSLLLTLQRDGVEARRA